MAKELPLDLMMSAENRIKQLRAETELRKMLDNTAELLKNGLRLDETEQTAQYNFVLWAHNIRCRNIAESGRQAERSC